MIETVSYDLNQTGGDNKNKTTMIIIVVVVLIALAGGFFFWQKQQTKDSEVKKVMVDDKKEPTSTPSPTAKPIDKSKVKIQILNGTGTPGEAKTAVDALVEAGYKTENITTGNAEEYDHAKTTISAKKGFEDVAGDIEKSLNSSFDTIEIDSQELDADGEFDVVVTTGGKIFEEPTGAPTTKPTLSTSSPTPTTTSTTTTPTPSSSPTPTP